MIARWMVGAALFAALLAIAALATERALSATGRPTRWPWVVALLAGAAWPLVAPFVLTLPAASVTMGATTLGAPIADSINGATPAPSWVGRVVWLLLHADVSLLVLWGVASAMLTAQLVRAVRALHRVRQRAERTTLDGEPVLVDAALGPAVIGLVDPRIVVPLWLLELDGGLRTLVLRHEREHCRAGDPQLVWLSAVITTVVPWNPALWWIARRLRASMEIDCDERTVRSDEERARYAKLLLLVAHQKMQARFIPMLSTSASQLSRRILAMQQRSRTNSTIRIVGALTVAVAAVAAACSPRIATNLTSPTPVANAPTASPAVVVEAPSPTNVTPPYFGFQVERPATPVSGSRGPRYPDSLRTAGVEGAVLAQFVVNADGSVDLSTFKVLRSTQALFSDAVRAALINMRFTPALVGNRAVKQMVQSPFEFSLSRGNQATRSAPASKPMSSGDRDAPAASMRVEPAASPVGAPKPLIDFQTAQSARPVDGSVGPAYPPELREAKVEGQVLVQFVVDSSGRAEMSTLKVLKSDHELFTQAVRDAVAQMKFDPAIVGGRKVKQLMQSPFQFSLARD